MYNDYTGNFPKKEKREVIRIALESMKTKDTNDDCRYDEKLKGPWRASQKLNFRLDASMDSAVQLVLEAGDKIRCEGYYKESGDDIWLKVSFNGYRGFVLKPYLTR